MVDCTEKLLTGNTAGQLKLCCWLMHADYHSRVTVYASMNDNSVRLDKLVIAIYVPKIYTQNFNKK